MAEESAAQPKDLLKWLPKWAERAPNEPERRVLETVYAVFLRGGVWPQAANVEAILGRDHGLELDELLPDFPAGLLWPDPSGGTQVLDPQPLETTLYALTFVVDAHRDVELFFEVLRWAVDRWMAHTPPVTGPPELAVSVRDVVASLKHLRRALTGADVIRVLMLARLEPVVPNVAPMSGQPNEGTLILGPVLRDYRNVRTLEDYFERRQPFSRGPVTQQPASSEGTPRGQPEEQSIGEAVPAEDEERTELGVPARALSDLAATVDRLGFAPLVDGLADLVSSRRTRLPFTVAVSGVWGAGKSSVMRQLQERLETTVDRNVETTSGPRRWVVAQFDAWKHEGSDRLWAALTKAMYEAGLEQQGGWLRRLRFKTTLECNRRGRTAFLTGLVTPFLPLLAGLAYAIYSASEGKNHGALGLGVGTLLTLLFVGAARWSSIQALITDPFKRAIDQYTIKKRFEGALGFTREAERDVRALTQTLTGDRADAIAIFVDDLDRCSPIHVVEVVEAVNQIFSSSEASNCLFVFGMDAEVIAASISAAYSTTIQQLPKDRAETFGADYLRKIAQLFVSVPEPDAATLGQLLEADREGEYVAGFQEEEVAELEARILAEAPESVQEVGTLVADLDAPAPIRAEVTRRARAAVFGSDSEDVRRAVAEILPLLRPNPRALKQYDSAYRLQLHVANDSPLSRLSFSYPQLVALAKWVLLRQRFPELARRALREPSLLAELEDGAFEEDALSTEAAAMLEDRTLREILRIGGAEKRISRLPLDSFLQII